MKYYLYCLKKNWLRILIITLFAAVVSFLSAPDGYNTESQYVNPDLMVNAYMIISMSILIPILEFSGFNKKSRLDVLYSMPLSRVRTGFSHYFSGLTNLIISYSVSFAAYSLCLISTGGFHTEYLLPFYALSLLYGLVLFTFCTFIFLQAYSIWDGVIFVGLWQVVLGLPFAALHSLLGRISVGGNNIIPYFDLFTSVNPISRFIDIFDKKIAIISHQYSSFITGFDAQYYKYTVATCIIWGVIGMLSLAGLFHTFKYKKAEHVEQISDSWLGYRILIPIYTVSLLAVWNDVLSSAVVLIIATVGMFIHRRGIKLRLSDYLVLAGSVTCALFFALLYWLSPAVTICF